MMRATQRLAGYGFVVAAPEIYHRIEPAGTVIPFDDEGRTRGLAGAAQTTVAEFDADCRAVLDYLDQHPSVERGKLGAGGFCIGGDSSFSAGRLPELAVPACFLRNVVYHGNPWEDG